MGREVEITDAGDAVGEAIEAPANASQAVIRGLRRRRDEAQLTQVLAELGASDARFARAFVELVLETLSSAGSTPAKALLKAGVPEKLRCQAEQHHAGDAKSLGRVDLAFEADGFALLIENKLHSGYGERQLERYAEAAAAIKAERVGLVAITRNVPTYGESAISSERSWVGSVRWAQLLEGGLRSLPVRDAAAEHQWKALIDVMQEDGDLGTTKANKTLIRSWAQYRDGRDQLVHLLEQISEPVLATAVDAFRGKHRGLTGDDVAALWTRGKKKLVVKPDQVSVALNLCVPAQVLEPCIWVGFMARDGEPSFEVGVWPWEGEQRLSEGDPQLKRALAILQAEGFAPEGNGWWTAHHEPAEYWDRPDVPQALVELWRPRIEAIARSKVLKRDIDLTLAKNRRGPPRKKRGKG